MTDKNTKKIYIKGAVGRGNEITDIFTKQFKCENPMGYKCGDTDSIYFINHRNELDHASSDSALYHILVNSDWEEMKLRTPKKTRKYIVTVQEGECGCDNCQFTKYCDNGRKSKCKVSETLSSFSGIQLNGSTMTITDYTDSKEPPNPECLWPQPWY